MDVVDPGQDKLEKLKDFCGCLTIWFNIGSLLSNQCRHGFLIIIIAFLQSNPRSSLPPSSFIFNILLFIQNPAVLSFLGFINTYTDTDIKREITPSWHSWITWPPAPKLSRTFSTVAYPKNLPLHIPPECFSLTSHSILSHWLVHPAPPPLQHFLQLPCCFNLLNPVGSFLPAVNLKMPLAKETQLREENSHQSNSNTKQQQPKMTKISHLALWNSFVHLITEVSTVLSQSRPPH